MILKFEMIHELDFDFRCQEGVTFPNFCRQLTQNGGIEFNGYFYPISSIKSIHIKKEGEK